MKLIIGLGNPEERYNHTRHNVGFEVLDTYAQKNGIDFANKDKFKAHVTELTVGDEKVIFAKPMTYYNQSGEAVRLLADFHKIEQSDILIVHDELALPFGTIRTRFGGSDAGNNGVKSVTAHIGPDTARIRIGIYNELRGVVDDANFVLGKFTKNEIELLKSTLEPKIHNLIDDFIAGSFDHVTHK